MILTICVAVVYVTFFAALGRSATPRHERLPWTRWTLRDLCGNVALGFRRLNELSERNAMGPRQRTPFHH